MMKKDNENVLVYMCKLTLLFSGWEFKKKTPKTFLIGGFVFQFFSSHWVTFADFDFYETSQLVILHIPHLFKIFIRKGFYLNVPTENSVVEENLKKRAETFTTFSHMWKLVSMAYIALSIVYVVDAICQLFSFNFWTFGWNQMVNSCFNFIFIPFIERWTILSSESC